jgi:glycosyltransferase involved in cell wall biosynthesis
MKIFLDNIIFSKSKNGGISNYWYELIQYLESKTDSDVSYFESKSDQDNFHRKKLSLPESKLISVKSKGHNRLLPISFKYDEKIIFHSSYYRGLSGCKNKIEVTTVYDFIHSFYSNFPNKQIHNHLKFNAIKRSRGVICISHNTYNDLNKLYSIKKNQNTTVIHVGVSDDYFPIKNYTLEELNFINKNKLEDDFLLFVGGRTNYKNFDFAASLINKKSNLKLAVVGGGLLKDSEIKLFSKDGLERVLFFPSLENKELNILFNKAKALIYPSSYEGFGIPVVEAMRAGCPVIGLNNATIREVAENSAILLDSLSLTEFDTKTKNLNDSQWRNEVIEKGFIESKKYSWEKCSKETFEFYQFLYDSPSL